MEDNVYSFLKAATDKGMKIKIPPTPKFRKANDISKESLEPVKSFIFDYARDIVRVDIYTETGFVNLTYIDSETGTVYNKLEMDYTSVHQFMQCMTEIERMISGKDSRKPE